MPPRKAPDRRQGRGTRDLQVVPSGGFPVPVPPQPARGRLLKVTTEAWEEFWADGMLAQLVRPADMPALRRLFSMYDERERALRAYQQERATAGSTGQLVVNPFAREMAALDARIEKLEARFGITPKGRMDLGVAMGQAQRTLEEMNRAYEDDLSDDELDADDPRLAAIDATATD